MVPIISFGPFAFIPLVIVGAVIDVLVFNGTGWVTVGASLLGLAFYVSSLLLSIWTLRTEKKAQERTYELLRAVFAPSCLFCPFWERPGGAFCCREGRGFATCLRYVGFTWIGRVAQLFWEWSTGQTCDAGSSIPNKSV